MLQLWIATLSSPPEQYSTLVRSYFALKESIQFLESYHRIGFMNPSDEASMTILQELERTLSKFDTLMIETA